MKQSILIIAPLVSLCSLALGQASDPAVGAFEEQIVQARTVL